MEKKGKRILSVSLAAAGLLASATSALGSVPVSPAVKATTSVENFVTTVHRALPSLLVLPSPRRRHVPDRAEPGSGPKPRPGPRQPSVHLLKHPAQRHTLLARRVDPACQ